MDWNNVIGESRVEQLAKRRKLFRCSVRPLIFRKTEFGLPEFFSSAFLGLVLVFLFSFVVLGSVCL